MGEKVARNFTSPINVKVVEVYSGCFKLPGSVYTFNLQNDECLFVCFVQLVTLGKKYFDTDWTIPQINLPGHGCL